MRTLVATVVLCLGGLAFSHGAQAPQGVIPGNMSADSNTEIDGVFYAKGNVRIQIGATTITADEAVVRRGAGYRMRDVEIRGNVHMTYQLSHD